MNAETAVAPDTLTRKWRSRSSIGSVSYESFDNDTYRNKTLYAAGGKIQSHSALILLQHFCRITLKWIA